MVTLALEDEKERILASLGLTQNEARVYLALSSLGLATATKISSMSKVHRVNVYDAIEKLKKRGLISHVINEGKKYFQATSPQNLLNILKEKEIMLQSILPQLELNEKLGHDKSDVEIQEGVSAIRNLFLHYLDMNEDILDFGATKNAINLLGQSFQNTIHQRRIKQKQRMLHIYNADAMERIKYLNTLPYTEARYLLPELTIPVCTRICGNEMSITHWTEKPVTIIIRNSQMAEAYKKYFWILWEISKKN